MDPNLRGVVVTGVAPGSGAQRAGLIRGDIILQVGEQRIQNTGQFRAALAEHDLEQGVRLVVRTGPANRYVFLQTN